MLNFQNGTDRNMEPRTPACSRAIMLLTDGALSDYQDAFINGTKLFDPMGEQTDIGHSSNYFKIVTGSNLRLVCSLIFILV